MLPVLFSVGGVSVSAFGVFLALGFLVGVFLVWRLIRAWDLDEEIVLDLTLLTFLGGLIGSRLYFVFEHLDLFRGNLLGIVQIRSVPGFSFWGALLGGALTLFLLAKGRRMNFAQIGDIASVGLLGSLILASIGCFLGGCGVGIPSNLFFAVNMVGFLGKRFPTQLIEAILILLVSLGLWSTATHFHIRGKILALSLIYLGAVKLLLSPLRQAESNESILSLGLLILGVFILYKVTKRNPVADLKGVGLNIVKLTYDSSSRGLLLVRVQKYWYNKKASISWKIRSFKKMLRRFNVRFSYKNN